MTNCKPSQSQRVLEYMATFGGITQYEALRDLGVMRLASRISELRKKGHKITSDWVNVENRFGEVCKVKRYKMDKEA